MLNAAITDSSSVRITRTVTGAVAQLYNATEHINRGDFRHRIAVQSHDQLAALASKVDALQRPAVPVQIPPPMAAPAPSPAPIAQTAPKPKKPPAPRAPKAAGPISTGGAPLTVSPDLGTR